MPSVFPGFPHEALEFFSDLAQNNTRDWFLPRKELFETHIKRPMVELVEALNRTLYPCAPEYVTDPGKAIYRFYRDTRFSHDKRPYKEQIAATFAHQILARHGGAGFYISVSDKEVAVGGGIYLPPPESLQLLRSFLAEHYEEFDKLASAPRVRRLLGEVQGEQLVRVPKGFPATHPAADLLRRKQLYFYANLDPALATTPALFKELSQRFRAMVPLMQFLDRPLLAAPKRAEFYFDETFIKTPGRQAVK